MKVTLTRKLARVLNGIDLTACHEGEVIEIRDRDARLLIAEGWAALVRERSEVHDRVRPSRLKKRR